MFPAVLNGTDNPRRLNMVRDKFVYAAVDSAVFATLKCTSAVRCQPRTNGYFHPHRYLQGEEEGDEDHDGP
jgi:hypothetical protein